MLELGAPSPELASLRQAAGLPDVTTGTERLTSEQQRSDWASLKHSLREAACRELARLVQDGELELAKACLLARCMAQLPLPPGYNSFTGDGRSHLTERVLVATALPVALPSEFSVAEAANAFGMNTTNKKGAYLNDALQLHGPLLRPLPLMMAKAAEQLAEEEPEQLSGRERVAAQLRKATGIVATAEAQQCTADEQWWQLSIVGWLADSLAGELVGCGDGSEAGSSSGGEADSSQAGGSSSVPLTYNTMDKAVAVCGGSRWQVLEHSKPEGALRWVFTQLGVVPPGKSAGGKVGGPAAAKAAKKNREAGGGGKGGKAKAKQPRKDGGGGGGKAAKKAKKAAE
ncbi:hypothetical protein C2E21_7377 isoform B [Chlorella sorokiniana]|uniref:Uncharacterized protein n=1 Tax=Chlorella sorokiniana TaxID=3076 RepID=A0A2P6TI65_CHLSO|nr:hypothetical protein C2E21_7377 isoform B [Chlorella sorokiniana]|eukprot:PRW33956.1 hypothetical protein C2E21_7377 isoform B [Chlorella sorokiniana]